MIQIRDALFRKSSSFANLTSIIKEIKYRWLLLPKALKKELKGKDIIWINAIGVGEWNLVEPLLKDLEKRYPDYVMLLSCPNKQVFEYVQRKFPEEHVIYTPFDIPSVVNKFFSRFTVKLLIMTETPGQIGVNFLEALNSHGGTSVLFNGLAMKEPRVGLMDMIRKKGYGERRGQAVFRSGCIDYLLMKEESEADKIITLGVDKSKIHIFGNVKYDIALSDISSEEKGKLYQVLKVDQNTPILLAGSVFSEEFSIIFHVYQELKKKYPALLLIVAPRHLIDVELALSKVDSKFRCFRKTELENKPSSHSPVPDIVILDTLGELKFFYSVATIAIVCGSFLPLYKGKNLLEPASYSKPIIFGRHMQNFASMAKLFVKEKGAFQVHDKVELIQTVERLLASEALRLEYGKNAYNVLKKNRGPLKRTIGVIDHILMNKRT